MPVYLIDLSVLFIYGKLYEYILLGLYYHSVFFDILVKPTERSAEADDHFLQNLCTGFGLYNNNVQIHFRPCSMFCPTVL